MLAPIAAYTAPAPIHVIPFELRAGHVLLTVTVNGRLATFVLDSGSSACTLDTPMGADLPVVGSPSTAVGGSGAVSITLARVEALQIGSLVLRDQTVALVPLQAVSEQHGRQISGTIGYTLFARYVVEIDYAARVLRLYEPASYRYEGSGVVLPIDLAMRIPIAHVTLKPEDGPPVDARLVLDLGTAMLAATFTAPFVEAHERNFANSRQMAVTATGVGGAGVGSVTRLEWIDVGGLRAQRPVAMLMRDHSGFFGVTWADGTIGADIFERTTTILDYSRQRVILEPAAGFQAPFEADASGLALSASATMDSILVRSVMPGSPSAEAGIRKDDVIASVDDVHANGESLEQVRSLLRTSGAVRRIVVRRHDSEMNILVTLRARI